MVHDVRQVQADLALLGVAAVWGLTFVLVKDALAAGGPFTFVALRFGLASLILAAALILLRRTRDLARSLCAGVFLGLFLCAGYVFQTLGLQSTTPGRAAFITGLAVVIVPVIAAIGQRKTLAPMVWLGVILATLGLALLTRGSDLPSGMPVDSAWRGDVLVLVCALAFAGHIVLAERFAPRFDAGALTLVQLVVTALVTTLAAMTVEQPTVDQLRALVPAALFTGLFATVLALTIQFRAQRFTSATHTALIFSTEPVFGALAAFVFVGERLSAPALAGCALILGGMVLAQLADTAVASDSR